MVLRLKTRESRSPPGPPSTGISDQGSEKHAAVTSFAIHAALRWHLIPVICPLSCIAAGWSSPVARQAHNLKVAGSNPAPATSLINELEIEKTKKIEQNPLTQSLHKTLRRRHP